VGEEKTAQKLGTTDPVRDIPSDVILELAAKEDLPPGTQPGQ
jgi:hypothetical protein